MRRLSALVLAAALGTSMFATTSADATEVSTCLVVVGVTVGPGGASVDKVVVKSVGDCV